MIQRVFLFAALFTGIAGCNALLGNDEGTGNSAAPGDTEKTKSGDDTQGDDDTTGTDASSTADAGTSELFPHSDATKPCSSCGATLVADIGPHPYAVQVSADYLFFADINGIRRIAHNQPACTSKEDCVGVIADQFNSESIRIAYDEKTDQLCWNDSKNFGCTDKSFATKSVELDAIGIESANTGLTIRNGQAYALYDQNHHNLGKASPTALASGGATFGAIVSSPASNITAFAVSDTHVVWLDDDATQKPRVTARRLDSNDSATNIAIPGAGDLGSTFISKIKVFNARVYLATASTVYSAPLDGSAKFAPHAKADKPIASLSVTSLGILVGFGDEGSYGSYTLAWGKLAAPAPGKSVPSLEALTSATGKISDIAVAKNSIYMAVNPFEGDGKGRGVWKVAIE